MDDRDQNRDRPTRTIYEASFRPTRALGQGLGGQSQATTTTSAARKHPDFNRRTDASGVRASFPGIPRRHFGSSSNNDNNDNAGAYDPWVQNRVYWGRDDRRGGRRDEDPSSSSRWEPANRALLPRPTYVLRGRGVPPSAGARLGAARKTSAADEEEEEPEREPVVVGGAHVTAARKRSVRFASDRGDHGGMDSNPVYRGRDGGPGKSTGQSASRWASSNDVSTGSASSALYRGVPGSSQPRSQGTPNRNYPNARSAQAPRIPRHAKSARVVTPAWHAHDASRRRPGGTAIVDGSLRGKTMMTASRRSALSAISAVQHIRSARKQEEEVDVIDANHVARGRVWGQLRVKAEDGDSDLEMDDEDRENAVFRQSAARKRDLGSRSQQAPIDIPSDSSESSEEQPAYPSESESPDDEDEQDEDHAEVELSDLENDFDSLFVRAPTVPPAAVEVFADEPTRELVDALESLTLRSLQMQRAGRLPFLPRQLRRGFEHRCRLAGVPTLPDHDKPSHLIVVYRYQEDNGEVYGSIYHGYQTRTDAWLCPLCEIHGRFKTREMLEKHIEWDHQEVTCSWQGNGEEWRVILTFPRPGVFERHPSLPMQEDVTRESGTSSRRSSSPSMDARIPSPRTLIEEEVAQNEESPAAPADNELNVSIDPTTEQHVPRPSPSPPQYRSETRTDTTSFRASAEPTPAASESSAGGPPVYKREMASPPPDHRSSASYTRSSTATASTTAHLVFKRAESQPAPSRPSTRPSSASASTRQVSTPIPDGFPPPPPPDKPFGPSIQPPYLPAVWEGCMPVYYSCRPGGPRLYDLLGVLPMEDFGVLAWSVIDKEEEIFEVDDLRDEDKVMQALWARWIFLNRNFFVTNYLKGTFAFINQYWLMIHRAAGWEALRNWLLVMVIHRFLTGEDVAKVLRHYESYTGMEYWCKVAPTDPSKKPPWNNEAEPPEPT